MKWIITTTIYNIIKNLSTKVDIYKKFRDKTESSNAYSKYIQQCLDKWYNIESPKHPPYIYTIVITAINSSTLEQTLNSIINNSLFNKLQILVLDISEDDNVEMYVNNNYKKSENVFYINCEEKNVSYSRNKAIRCAIGKYIYFINSGQEIYYDFLNKSLEFMENNTDTNIVISSYLNNKNIVMELLFENLNIGPILQCCVIRRSCINDICFENVPCSDIIFTGILCKHNKYEYIKSRIYDVNISFINNEESEKLFPKLENKNNENWVTFTQNKIKEHYL